jgi:purine-binding chemotaxis protein CheW
MNGANGHGVQVAQGGRQRPRAVVPEVASQRCLVCDVGELRFAVPMTHLDGVEPYERATPLPRLPPWVAGVANVRGAIVGVVDLARFFGLGETRVGQGRLLVCNAGPRRVALAVASARSLVDYPESSLVQPPNVSGRVARYVAGLVSIGDTAALWLNVERLLADRELISG